MQESTQLQVSSDSNPKSVAGAIAGAIRDHGRCSVQAIGAAAVNQSVKSIAIARGYLAPNGYDLACIPSFVDVQVEDESRTGIRFLVHNRAA